MAVAVSRALERGAPGIVCASTGNTAASAAAYAARAGLRASILPAGRGRARQGRAGARGRRRAPRDRRHVQRAHLEARRLAERGGLVNVNSINPRPDRGPVVRRTRDGRAARRPPGRARAAVRRRRQHGRATRRGSARALPRSSSARRRSGSRRSRPRSGSPTPVHQTEVDGVLERSGGQVVSCRRSSSSGVAFARARGGHLLRARAAAAARRASVEAGSVVCVVTGHGLKDRRAVVIGPTACRGTPTPVWSDAIMSVRPRPATTANLGPGFDCAGVALELWNELELTRPATAPSIATTSACAPSSCSPRPTAGASGSPTASRRPAGSAPAPR